MLETTLKLCGCQVKVIQLESEIYRIIPFKNEKKFAYLIQSLQNFSSFNISDIIFSESEILISYFGDIKDLKRRLKNRKERRSVSKLWELNVWFCETKDWFRVEKETGLSKKKFIKKLVQVDFEVGLFGFQPGFVYLKGMPKKLMVSRKKTPEFNTFKNAFAVGGPYAGIYSFPSPAGWNVLGKLLTPIFDWDSKVPSMFQIGDRLRIKEISESQYTDLSQIKSL